MQKKIEALVIAVLLIIAFLSAYKSPLFSQKNDLISGPLQNSADKLKKTSKPKYVRGIHITPWVAGSKKVRARIDRLLDETELNTLIIAVKEVKGQVYIPGVKYAEELGLYKPALPYIRSYLENLKERNVYTIARIVVFKDDILPRIKPEWAVKNSSGTLWRDYKGKVWLDPFCRESWEYTFEIAERAAELGFDEIQYDYIRFPSDGRISQCVYSQEFSSITAVSALVEFLKASKKRLEPLGVKTSVDLFGLATTENHDLGIGQKIVEMAEHVDFVSPMVYPSHYRRTTYGIAHPNKDPYSTVYISMRGAKRKMGDDYTKLRPYLQDFSLGHTYTEKEVLDQIQACYNNDVAEWLLWDPWCKYTEEALKSPEFSDVYDKTDRKPIVKISISSDTIKKQ